MRIGVPRALLYYNYQQALAYFAELAVAEIVLSTPTNKTKLERGLTLCADEVCLPVKIFMGHVHSLLGQVDAFFVPRVVCFERRRYACPKFIGLPDMVRAAFDGKVSLISPTVDLSKNRLAREMNWRQAGGGLRARPRRIRAGFAGAILAQKDYDRELAETIIEPSAAKRVAVLGHCYNIFDEYLNFSLLRRLAALGVQPLTLGNFSTDQIEAGAAGLEKDLFWHYGRQMAGAALYCLRTRAVAGVILVASFGCGPDSLIMEIISRRFSSSSLPLMTITLDEHSADIGLVTRVEAFVDMLNWRDAK